jgi:hypothetical protein
MTEWCRQITKATGVQWRYTRVNQTVFSALKVRTLAELIEAGTR